MSFLVLDRPFRELQNDILDSYERFIFLVGFYFGKMWKFLEKRQFFRADMAGLGNTTQADMAGLGSIGLKVGTVPSPDERDTNSLDPQCSHYVAPPTLKPMIGPYLANRYHVVQTSSSVLI